MENKCPVTGKNVAKFYDAAETCMKYIFDEDIEISYTIHPGISSGGHEDPSYCAIDLIQNTSGEYGQGKGNLAMRSFLSFLAGEVGIDDVRCFVEYDTFYYFDEDEGIENDDVAVRDGIERLLGFYGRLGFEMDTKYEDNSSQVDMSIILDPAIYPKAAQDKESITSSLLDDNSLDSTDKALGIHH